MGYLYRKFEENLKKWKGSTPRRPLLMRGARQVGKSRLIRNFGETQFPRFFEFNFEKHPQLKAVFQKDLDPKRILSELEFFVRNKIGASDLIFLDEIQECPEALKSLRYFFEELPAFHVIAAGSLLEFVIGATSIPVGRLEYGYLYPMSFSEFLAATDRKNLVEVMPIFPQSKTFAQVPMKLLYDALREYLIVGGMPEAVAEYARTRSFQTAQDVQDVIVKTFRDDVHKYTKGGLQLTNLEQTMTRVFRWTGQTIKFSSLHPEDEYKRTKRSLELLEKAMLIHRVPSANPRGLPLGAEASDKHFKCIFLDVGLGQRLSGLDPSELVSTTDLLSTYEGRLAEQFVGQELLSESKGSEDQKLYCWIRAQKSSSAEVDYLLVRKNEIIPLEVKAGKAGHLKSLHVFLAEFPNTKRAICLQHRNNISRVGNIELWPLFTKV